jgi:hypothetical protein
MQEFPKQVLTAYVIYLEKAKNKITSLFCPHVASHSCASDCQKQVLSNSWEMFAEITTTDGNHHIFPLNLQVLHQ